MLPSTGTMSIFRIGSPMKLNHPRPSQAGTKQMRATQLSPRISAFALTPIADWKNLKLVLISSEMKPGKEMLSSSKLSCSSDLRLRALWILKGGPPNWMLNTSISVSRVSPLNTTYSFFWILFLKRWLVDHSRHAANKNLLRQLTTVLDNTTSCTLSSGYCSDSSLLLSTAASSKFMSPSIVVFSSLAACTENNLLSILFMWSWILFRRLFSIVRHWQRSDFFIRLVWVK